MKSLSPEDLPSYRVFFTEFDRSYPKELAPDLATGQASLERKLKLLLLTKSHIVVAASQLLESKFAHSILLNHPELIESGALVSSMKEQHESTTDFLAVKRREAHEDSSSQYHSSRAEETASLLDSQGTAVRWKLSAMSNWFRDRLASDLLDSESLLGHALKRADESVSGDLVKAIELEEALSRPRVEELTLTYAPTEAGRIIKNYANFLYYLSGARTTESQGVLPQENLMDFSLSELVGSKHKLDEHEVFFKIFVDTIKARTETLFPREFLDAISINDALELRQVGIGRGFVERYNQIQITAKEGLEIRDPERLVLILSELQELEISFREDFCQALDGELDSLSRERRRKSGGIALASSVRFVLPGAFDPANYHGALTGYLGWFKRDEWAKVVDHKYQSGLNAMELQLERRGVLDAQPLLDFVSKMNDTFRQKLFTT